MKVKLTKYGVQVRATEKDRGYYRDEYDVEDVVYRLTRNTEGTLGIHEDVKTGEIVGAFMHPSKAGIPGNGNTNIKNLHGWCGTYDDVACYAHGLKRVKKVVKLKRGYGFRVELQDLENEKTGRRKA